MLKVIKTASDYETALREVRKLVHLDPEPSTTHGDRLEVLALLISTYEDEHFPVGLPTPIEAIRFRMDQEGLTQRDLIPFIGSRSKVSEILRGKRDLTLRMIRGLHAGLEIPAEVLLQEPGAIVPSDSAGVDWSRFPIREMARRKYLGNFQGKLSEAVDQAEELLRSFFAEAGICRMETALLRQHVRSGSQMDKYALLAWWGRVAGLARGQDLPRSYERGTVTRDFISSVARLSYLGNGPVLAKEFLAKSGIHLVLLSHLPRTHLDGAAMLLSDGTPVIALTLRHDRLDNFWFCLCHELAHVGLHLEDGDEDRYFDNLDAEGDRREREADKLAASALIPPAKWARARVRAHPRPAAVVDYADTLRVHPAVVAGRIRRERGNYRILSRLVGHGEVRCHFSGYETGVA